MLTLPTSLNGYKVVSAIAHKACVTVMVDRGESFDRYVIATWWPELKNGWCWGHYTADSNHAQSLFTEVAKRNDTRN